MVQVIPISSTQASDSPTSPIATSFDLTMPKGRLKSDEDQDDTVADAFAFSRQWSHLPSTLSANSILGPDACNNGHRFGAMVSYIMQAHLFRNGKTMGTTSKAIRIFDNMEPQPPTCLSDFSSEYTWQQKKRLRKHVFTSVGVFSAAIAEPDPFLFCTAKDSASTRLPVRFAVRGPSRNENCSNASVPPVAFSATVTWRLRTSTFLSTEPLSFVPTVNQVHNTPSMTLITSLGLEHQLKLALTGWKKMPSSSTICIKEEQGIEDDAWTIEEELALSISTATQLPPTFNTPHLSRRYSLIVQIKVAGTGKASLQLEVPVQVVYGNEPCRRTGDLRAQRSSSRNSSSSRGATLGERDQTRHILDADDAVVDILPAYVP